MKSGGRGWVGQRCFRILFKAIWGMSLAGDTAMDTYVQLREVGLTGRRQLGSLPHPATSIEAGWVFDRFSPSPLSSSILHFSQFSIVNS